MQHALISWAQARGDRVAWGPGRLAAEARHAILARERAGEFDPAFFESELRELAEMPDPSSLPTLIMVAMPRPAHRARFEFDLAGLAQGHLDAVLPPHYVPLPHGPTYEDVRRDLAGNGLPGARVERAEGPRKVMAAALGLVRYGRNNLTYVDGVGSYHRLMAYATDAALPALPPPHGPMLLDECASCDRCARACPTGAIRSDRVLLHGERCLTLANESAGAWPAWVEERMFGCLVGCLLCQRACPANPKLVVEETGIVFSVAETQALIERPTNLPAGLEAGIRDKLDRIGLGPYLPLLGRNLLALIRRGRRLGPA